MAAVTPKPMRIGCFINFPVRWKAHLGVFIVNTVTKSRKLSLLPVRTPAMHAFTRRDPQNTGLSARFRNNERETPAEGAWGVESDSAKPLASGGVSPGTAPQNRPIIGVRKVITWSHQHWVIPRTLVEGCPCEPLPERNHGAQRV